jgi:Fe-S-cluster containining protein
MSGSPRPPHGSAGKRPWYAEGLRFACVPDCGACCTRHGDYDYVYLDPDDVDRLAAELDLERSVFLERHAAEDDGYVVLRMDGPDCPFLRGTACSVYQARPNQCRTFPFWRENLKNRATWERLRSFCPGIDEGEVHGFENIRRVAGTKPAPVTD